MVGCSADTVWLSAYLPLAWAGHCCLGLAMGVLGPTQPYLAAQVNTLEKKLCLELALDSYLYFEGWSPEQTNQLHLDWPCPRHLHSSSHHKLRLPFVHQEELAETDLPCFWPDGHRLVHPAHTMDNLLLAPLVFSSSRRLQPWLL